MLRCSVVCYRFVCPLLTCVSQKLSKFFKCFSQTWANTVSSPFAPPTADTPIEEFTPTPAFPALQYLESVDEGGVAWQAGLRTGDFLIEVRRTYWCWRGSGSGPSELNEVPTVLICQSETRWCESRKRAWWKGLLCGLDVNEVEVEVWMLMERRFTFDPRLVSEVEMLSCDSLACFIGLVKETLDKTKLFLHFCCH